MHLDLDVLDPSVFPAQFPAPGGLSSEELRDLLGSSRRARAIVGLEITAFEAPDDEDAARPARGDDRVGRGAVAVSVALRPLVDDLHERRAQARLGGGEEKIAKQHAADKLTARERLALLIDDGTFTELGLHARPHFSQRAMEGRDAPGRRRDHRLRQGRRPAWSPCAPTTSR